MKVIVERAYGRHSVGDVIPDMPAGQARTLIARGLVREAGVEVEKSFASPKNRMMAAVPVKRKA